MNRDRLRSPPMLSLQNISKRFFARDRIINALEGISLDVASGEFLTHGGAERLRQIDEITLNIGSVGPHGTDLKIP